MEHLHLGVACEAGEGGDHEKDSKKSKKLHLLKEKSNYFLNSPAGPLQVGEERHLKAVLLCVFLECCF